MSFVQAKTLFETAQLPAANTDLYTAPVGTRTIIDKMTVTNPTAAAVTVTVFLVPAAGAAGAANTVISAQSVAAGQSYLCPEVAGHVLNTGDKITAVASTATALVVRVSGREVS
jgi:hypothetical protein